MVLCIDEVEELAKLGNRKRQDQALRSPGVCRSRRGDGGYSYMCMYLAATPRCSRASTTFLATTPWQPVSNRLVKINWRAPVIDLDRTPLQQSGKCTKWLSASGEYIEWHTNPMVPKKVPPAFIDKLLVEVGKSRFRIAKPVCLRVSWSTSWN
ncbi:MAG: hypothetical protein IPH55_06600 [Betaproteobacteria bacterium]|nr:hypothetical protein [Betaproteobacteria bacterium]